MSTHLTRPMMGCRLRDCGAPDCPVCAGAEAARIYREQAACDRDEHEQRTEWLAGQAEDAADARETP